MRNLLLLGFLSMASACTDDEVEVFGSVKSTCCPVLIASASNDYERGLFCKESCPEGDIVIPNSVSELAEEAFFNCANMTSVILPEGMTKISKYAFELSPSESLSDVLTSVTFPSTLIEIGYMAFYRRAKLTTIDLSRTKVTTINQIAFHYVEVEKVLLPGTLTELKDRWLGTSDTQGNLAGVIYTGSKPAINLLPTCSGSCTEIVCPIGYDPNGIDLDLITCPCPADKLLGCDNTCGFTVDNCNICSDPLDNNCVQDCNGDWGGTVVIDCEGVCGGDAKTDCEGVCGDSGCTYTLTAIDSYGDGWDSLSVYTAYDIYGNPTTISLLEGGELDFTIERLDYVEVTTWNAHNYINEESLQISFNGDVLTSIDTDTVTRGDIWFPTSSVTCGGSGFPPGTCDCYGTPPDVCGVCGGPGIPAGTCDCDGGTACLASELGTLILPNKESLITAYRASECV